MKPSVCEAFWETPRAMVTRRHCKLDPSCWRQQLTAFHNTVRIGRIKALAHLSSRASSFLHIKRVQVGWRLMVWSALRLKLFLPPSPGTFCAKESGERQWRKCEMATWTRGRAIVYCCIFVVASFGVACISISITFAWMLRGVIRVLCTLRSSRIHTLHLPPRVERPQQSTAGFQKLDSKAEHRWPLSCARQHFSSRCTAT